MVERTLNEMIAKAAGWVAEGELVCEGEQFYLHHYHWRNENGEWVPLPDYACDPALALELLVEMRGDLITSQHNYLTVYIDWETRMIESSSILTVEGICQAIAEAWLVWKEGEGCQANE